VYIVPIASATESRAKIYVLASGERALNYCS
jgi:hypothetical protein